MGMGTAPSPRPVTSLGNPSTSGQNVVTQVNPASIIPPNSAGGIAADTSNAAFQAPPQQTPNQDNGMGMTPQDNLAAWRAMRSSSGFRPFFG